MKNKILSLFEEHSFLYKEDICELLNETDIDAYLEELCNDYILYKNKANKYGLLASFNYYVGNIRLHKKGYGFFKCDQFDEDIFIKAIDLDNALDNDTVMVWVAPGNKNEKKDAYVVKVLHHNNDLICKVVKKFFHSTNKMIVCDTYPDVRIKVDDYKDASFDDIIILKVLDVDLVNKNTIYGEIKEIIGNKNDNGIDIKACVYKYGLDLDFIDEVKEDIERINNKYLNDKAREYKKRRRVNRDIITIDGADAKDLDDAISVKRNEDGTYFLGVYIADVSYFVEEDSEVDKEALKRGTSVYLVNKVIPMLPKKLSNDLCSLNENEDKYVIAVEMIIDKYGHRFAGGHALDRLVDILIQRIAAVAGDDDIGFRNIHLTERTEKFASLFVRLFPIPGECPDDFFRGIDHHIHDEIEPDRLCGEKHVAVDRVVCQIARPRVGASDEFGAVIRQHGLSGCDPRQNAFPAAGKSGEKVRLDEALSDQQIGFRREFVHDQFAARGKGSEFDQKTLVAGVVYDDGFPVDDVASEFFLKFPPSGSAMEARGDEDRDPDLRIALPEPLQYLRHDGSGGNGAGMVARDDDCRLFAAGKFFEKRRTDRVIQRLAHRGVLVFRGLRDGGSVNAQKIPFRDDRFAFGSSVRHSDFRHDRSLYRCCWSAPPDIPQIADGLPSVARLRRAKDGGR